MHQEVIHTSLVPPGALLFVRLKDRRGADSSVFLFFLDHHVYVVSRFNW